VLLALQVLLLLLLPLLLLVVVAGLLEPLPHQYQPLPAAQQLQKVQLASLAATQAALAVSQQQHGLLLLQPPSLLLLLLLKAQMLPVSCRQQSCTPSKLSTQPQSSRPMATAAAPAAAAAPSRASLASQAEPCSFCSTGRMNCTAWASLVGPCAIAQRPDGRNGCNLGGGKKEGWREARR
jgi:hypothetical protein